jgi:16S rRNA (uracil1498-N3)-methyltransferase
VLRLRPGEVVAVFDGSGSEWTVRLDEVKASKMQGEVIEKRRPEVEPAVALTLCQAVLKADRFEFVLHRCTEAGVARFQPFVSERCVAEMPRGKKLERWERIVREAAEQSGRVVVPPILPPIGLAELPHHSELTPAIALWEGEQALSLHAALDRLKGAGATGLTNLSLLVGPEGGLGASEVERLVAAGIDTASIGPRILRAETAALAATVAALYHFDQMER